MLPIKLLLVPKKNKAGIVANPKIPIYIEELRIEPVARALARKKYTNVHGISPFNMPKIKKLDGVFDLNVFRWMVLNILMSKISMVGIFSFPIMDIPISSISIPKSIIKTPLYVEERNTTYPKKPKIAPNII